MIGRVYFMNEAIINENFVLCPICGRKIFEVTGEEEVKNLRMRCPRKLNGEYHEFTLNINAQGA